MTASTTPVIGSAGGPVAADDIDERVAQWCRVLGIPLGDISTEEDPEI